MFSFDATPVASIGTECIGHVKPSRRQTWGYHTIKAWYFSPTLNHYSCVRVVTDTGAVHTTYTFTFLPHTIPVPNITAVDCIIRATKHLRQAIDGHTAPAHDELEAIAALKALITRSPPAPRPEPVMETPPHEDTTTVNHYKDEPVHLPLQDMPMPSPPLPTLAHPTAIPFHDNELDIASSISATPVRPHTCYNLLSQAQHIIQSALNDGLVIPQDHIAFAVIDKAIGKALEHRDLIKLDDQKDIWTTSYANKLGRLTQGIQDIPGTNTVIFIHRSEVPKDHQNDITYGRIVVALQPQKKEPWAAISLTTDYPWEVATPTSDLTTAKLLFNSVVPTPGTVFVVMDVKNFYLNNPMACPDMRLPHTTYAKRQMTKVGSMFA
eukprot:CCRYP_006558-RA/>CCRYP_006558-RA protein AED:0.41 eAED:0.35 QI:0/-1/0/1/-1/1/1/0/379